MSYNAENRRIKAQCTKRKIYESAKRLFSSKDYNDVSVDSIVELAGVSKGSFYVHYASKDALVTALLNDQVSQVDTDYRSFIDSFPNDTPTQALFLSLIGKIADVLNEIGCYKMQVLYKAQITKDLDTGAVTSYNREIYKMFSNVLERGIKRGEFKTNFPLDVLTKHFMMAIRGITYEWCIRYPEFDYKTESLNHFELLLEGLQN
jgi:AcrR family transcriptional regulator